MTASPASPAPSGLSVPTLRGSLLVKPVSADCNLECVYCFYLDKAALYPQTSPHRMRPATLDSLIRQAMTASPGPVAIAWQGGEPLLAGLDFFRRVFRLEQKYGRPGQVVSNAVQTNGVLLDDDWARLFHRYNVLVGLSLDGPRDLHDRYRRTRNDQPTYDLVRPKIELLRRHGVEFNVLTVVNELTVRHPQRLLQFCLDSGVGHVQLLPCVEMAEDGEVAPFSMPAEAYGDFLCTLFDLWFSAGPQRVSVRLFEALLARLAGGENPMCFFRECCDTYLVVEANGDVYPCDFFVEPRWRVGNLCQTPLWELEETALRRAFAAAKTALPMRCRQCEYEGYCHGGCPRYRSIRSPSYLCAGYRQLFTHALPRLRKMAAAVRRGPRAPAAGRNDPCPCGSGQKFKRCCGR